MGTEIRCIECGQTLFKFEGVPDDILWYSQLRKILGEECPNCGHKLPKVSNYAKKIQIKVKLSTPILAE